MHVISRKKLVKFWTEHAEAEESLAAWFKLVEKGQWQNWADVKKCYPKAGYYRCCLIFNIRGGSYRLIVRRSVNWKTLFVVGVLNHAEYDRNAWKNFCGCR